MEVIFPAWFGGSFLFSEIMAIRTEKSLTTKTLFFCRRTPRGREVTLSDINANTASSLLLPLRTDNFIFSEARDIPT